MATIQASSGVIAVAAGVETYGTPVPAAAATIIQVAVQHADPGTTTPVTIGLQASADGLRWSRLPVMLRLGPDTTEAKHISVCSFRHYRVVASAADPVTLLYAVTLDTAYADPADLAALSIPDHALRDVSEASKLRALLAASDELDGYLHAHYQLPLTSWGHDLRMHCAGLAAAVLMRARGYSPEAGSDELIRMMRTDALEWADRVATGKLSPPALVDSTPDVLDAGAIVKGRGPRGW